MKTLTIRWDPLYGPSYPDGMVLDRVKSDILNIINAHDNTTVDVGSEILLNAWRLAVLRGELGDIKLLFQSGGDILEFSTSNIIGKHHKGSGVHNSILIDIIKLRKERNGELNV